MLTPLDPEAIVEEMDAIPDEIFHREWQREMFELAIEDLRKLCDVAGWNVRYELFAAYDLVDEPRVRYEDLAAARGLTVTTVTNHLAWARRELRRLLEVRLGLIEDGERERRREMRNLLTKGSQ